MSVRTARIDGRSAGNLYVIGEGNGNGVVKIGRSAKPTVRLAEIQIGNPKKLHLLLVVPDGGRREASLHQAFSRQRLWGEWFDFGNQDPVAVVQHMLDELTRRGTKPEPKTPSTGSGSVRRRFRDRVRIPSCGWDG